MIYYDDELYHYDDELYHHGVKGMKWGVRRFQKKLGNGVARIRRKGSQFYKKHKTGIRRAAIGAGVAGLAAGAYALDRRFNGGRGAKAISGAARSAYGKAANSRFGRGVAGAYGKAKSGVTNAYRKANNKLGDYYNRKANQEHKWAQSAHNRIWDYEGKGYKNSSKMAGWNEKRHLRKSAKYGRRSRRSYSRGVGGSRSYLPTVRG